MNHEVEVFVKSIFYSLALHFFLIIFAYLKSFN